MLDERVIYWLSTDHRAHEHLALDQIDDHIGVQRRVGVADRAYVISHGQLVVEGVAAELAQRVDLLQASYLGDSVVAEAAPGP
jgi:hypothetical protein